MTDSPRVRAPGSAPAVKPPELPPAGAPPLRASRHGVVLADEVRIKPRQLQR